MSTFPRNFARGFIPNIVAPDPAIRARLQHAIDQKTKPVGALGQLEALALRIGLIQQTLQPELRRPAVLVFAADHGVAQAGVSAYPPEVTAQMVRNFVEGGAAINVFARQHGFALEVVDAGIRQPLPDRQGWIDCRMGPGTDNFVEGPAMSSDTAKAALEAGMGRVAHHAGQGSNVICVGEMGIGNTSSAACLLSALAGIALDDCVGSGTGLDEAGVQRKRAVLAQALSRHAALLDAQADPLQVLAALGGFEIAMMTGAFLEAASRRMVIVVDGFIASAALLVAQRFDPLVLQYCVFSHLSQERGHRALLAHFGAQPLLALDLRLGEGTGAALAYPLLVSAVAFLREMATFGSAGVSSAVAPDGGAHA